MLTHSKAFSFIGGQITIYKNTYFNNKRARGNVIFPTHSWTDKYFHISFHLWSVGLFSAKNVKNGTSYHTYKQTIYKYLSGRSVKTLYAFCWVLNIGLDLLYWYDPNMNAFFGVSRWILIYFSRAQSYIFKRNVIQIFSWIGIIYNAGVSFLYIQVL